MTFNLEVSTENLLNAIVQMPEKEFNRFVADAKKLRTENRQSGKEADLMFKINSVFEHFPRRRYDELNTKFEAETLTKDEYRKLLKLSDKSEILSAKRLGYILQLAKLKHQTLEEAFKGLTIKPSQK